MKNICFVLLLAFALTGCKAAYEIVPDTIVDVPLDPTRPPDGSAPQVTEALTEAPTRPPAPEVPTGGGLPAGQDPEMTEPDIRVTGSLDRDIVGAVNARRQEAGLAPLILDERLCAMASVRALENTMQWGHTRPDGRDWITVLDDCGYGYSSAAENVWYGAGTAGDIVGKWMGDPDARAALLMDAASIGVGIRTTADGVTYAAVLIAG